MKYPNLIGLLLITPFMVFSNSSDTTIYNTTYHERVSDGILRFFYDDHYYLVAKSCQFKAIERVGQYDTQQQQFVGEFTDFDHLGRVILKGSYQNGKKEGDFSAYHANGQLKWTVSYTQDVPQGLWKYYYPDGKPLLEVDCRDASRRILNFWDQRGRQRVTDGKGRYEFGITASDYNEFGYTRYYRKGNIRDGLAHGTWIVDYQFNDEKKQNAGYEYYLDGKFIQGYETYTDEEFSDAPRYRILPEDTFIRAEAMIAKECTIDAYTGFTGYLAKHLEDWFEGELREIPDPTKIEFNVSVDKTGSPIRVEIQTAFSSGRYNALLSESLSNIGFWFPSYANGEYIADQLNVTAEAFLDINTGELRFFNVRILREKGI